MVGEGAKVFIEIFEMKIQFWFALKKYGQMKIASFQNGYLQY